VSLLLLVVSFPPLGLPVPAAVPHRTAAGPCQGSKGLLLAASWRCLTSPLPACLPAPFPLGSLASLSPTSHLAPSLPPTFLPPG
jgi:hypothetical protein